MVVHRTSENTLGVGTRDGLLDPLYLSRHRTVSRSTDTGGAHSVRRPGRAFVPLSLGTHDVGVGVPPTLSVVTGRCTSPLYTPELTGAYPSCPSHESLGCGRGFMEDSTSM